MKYSLFIGLLFSSALLFSQEKLQTNAELTKKQAAFIEQQKQYFHGEKETSLLLCALGMAALGLTTFFLRKPPFYKGMALPLVLIGLLQLGVGINIYQRTDQQVADLKKQFIDRPAEFKAEESTRIKAVQQGFQIYKVVEVLLFVIGILLLLFGIRRKTPYLKGLGFALAVESVIMLVIDLFAAARADEYLQQIAVYFT